jgi:hypothetical protein
MSCLGVFVHHVCAIPEKDRRECLTLWSWSYRQLSASVWVLGIEPVSSARAACLSSHGSLSYEKLLMTGLKLMILLSEPQGLGFWVWSHLTCPSPVALSTISCLVRDLLTLMLMKKPCHSIKLPPKIYIGTNNLLCLSNFIRASLDNG